MANHTIQAQKRIKQNKLIIASMLTGIYILAYVYICHFLYIYKNNPRMELTNMSGIVIKSILTNPLTPLSGTLPFLGIYILGGMAAVMMYTASRKPKAEPLEDNEFMNPQELKEYNREYVEPFGKVRNDPDKSLIYTKDLWLSYLNEQTGLNMNGIIIAGSGKGKTFRFVSPNLLHLHTNAVVTDPSRELLRKYGKYLENKGYRIIVFDNKDPYRGSRYNPFVYISCEQDAIVLIDTFIANTTGKGEKCGEKFWIDCERFVLYSITLYMYHYLPKKHRTFRTMLKMLKYAEIDENNPSAKSKLDLLFEDLEKEDPENTAVSFYKDFKVGAGNTLKSILISVNARVSKLELPSMQYLTDEDEMDLDSFSDRKTVLFVCIPSGDHSFDFIVSMLYSQLFMKMYSYAEDTAEFGFSVKLPESGIINTFRVSDSAARKRAYKNAIEYKNALKSTLSINFNKDRKLYEVRDKKNRLITWRGSREDAANFIMDVKNAAVVKCDAMCPIHVQLFLDEFANISEIPDFAAKLSTIRKYQIGCSIILQGIGQLEKNYKDDWETITSNCDVKLFLGSSDDKSIKWLQSLLGKREKIVRSETHQANRNVSVSYSPHSVDMLTSYQIQQMKKDYCVAIVTNNKPLFGFKYNTKEDPLFKDSLKTKGQFRVNRRKPKRYADRDVPLIERRKRTDPEKSVQKHGIPPKIAVQNAARKIEAGEAQKALKDFKEYDLLKADTEKDLMNAFGLSPSMSHDDLKETVETLVSLMELPKGEISYRQTG